MVVVNLCLLHPPASRQWVTQSLYGQPLAVNPLQLVLAHRSLGLRGVTTEKGFAAKVDVVNAVREGVDTAPGRGGVTPVAQTPNQALVS
jgi:hypothetical protein